MKIGIIGAGVSGVALAVLAKNDGHDVLISDIKEFSPPPGVRAEVGHNEVFSSDKIILSSGIPPHSRVVTEALARGIEISGELDFVLPKLDGKIIGITGTNGKSTTTTLIGHILDDGKKKIAVGGNLGLAMADFVGEKYDYIVLELSSAQLHYSRLKNLKNFVAAVLTNLAPDHIDWHGSYEKYIEAKMRIFDILSANGVRFTRETMLPYRVKNSPLIGKHNLENITMSVGVVKKFCPEITDDEIAVRISTYKNLPHRCELVAEIGGVRYVNDSKGTNVGAATTALQSLEGEKIIILGGQGKGESYVSLAECVKRCAKHALVIGSEREKISLALTQAGIENKHISKFENLSQAVKFAREITRPGDTVLLSPACTSWDQYKNYGERGEHFRSLVLDGA